MGKCSVTDIFNEIIKESYNVKENEVNQKASYYRSDLENKFRQFLRCLYESVILEKSDKFDVSNISRKNQNAYVTFKEELAKLSSEVSYAKFANWINIKEVVDFYRITETEIENQVLQIDFYKRCKKAMWKFLNATNHIKNVEQVTRSSLNTDKIYEHIKNELEAREIRSVVKTDISILKSKHSKELEKLREFQKKKKKNEERQEEDGEKVQIAILYYLEKQILKCISEDEEEYDDYYCHFEQHRKKMQEGFIGQREREKTVRKELIKRMIVEENIEMENYLDTDEQNLVYRCRDEFLEKSDELLEEIIKQQSEEMKKEQEKAMINQQS